MSRIAKKPLEFPKGIEVKQDGSNLNIKGPKGAFDFVVHEAIDVAVDAGKSLSVSLKKGKIYAKAMVGTTCVLLRNIMKGVTEGFEKKLQLVGVGYRAAAKGKTLDLTLGFSHPVKFAVPEGITIETPSNTEILVKGIDKQLVGETAAKIRKIRAPECYKGKGVRYADERISLKETKKK